MIRNKNRMIRSKSIYSYAIIHLYRIKILFDHISDKSLAYPNIIPFIINQEIIIVNILYILISIRGQHPFSGRHTSCHINKIIKPIGLRHLEYLDRSVNNTAAKRETSQLLIRLSSAKFISRFKENITQHAAILP